MRTSVLRFTRRSKWNLRRRGRKSSADGVVALLRLGFKVSGIWGDQGGKDYSGKFLESARCWKRYIRRTVPMP